jgi:hypothetical protein
MQVHISVKGDYFEKNVGLNGIEDNRILLSKGWT